MIFYPKLCALVVTIAILPVLEITNYGSISQVVCTGCHHSYITSAGDHKLQEEHQDTTLGWLTGLKDIGDH